MRVSSRFSRGHHAHADVFCVSYLGLTVPAAVDPLDHLPLALAVLPHHDEIQVNVWLGVQHALIILVEGNPSFSRAPNTDAKVGAAHPHLRVLHETFVTAIHPVCTGRAVCVADVDALKVLNKVIKRHPEKPVRLIQGWVQLSFELVAARLLFEKVSERSSQGQPAAIGRKPDMGQQREKSSKGFQSGRKVFDGNQHLRPEWRGVAPVPVPLVFAPGVAQAEQAVSSTCLLCLLEGVGMARDQARPTNVPTAHLTPFVFLCGEEIL